MRIALLSDTLILGIFACAGPPPPELEVFGTADEGLVEADEEGVLQTLGNRMTVSARWNGVPPAYVRLFVAGPIKVEEARADDGTALPEARALKLDEAPATGLGAAEREIRPERWLVAPGTAWRVRAEALAPDGRVVESERVAWIGDAPGEHL